MEQKPSVVGYVKNVQILLSYEWRFEHPKPRLYIFLILAM